MSKKKWMNYFFDFTLAAIAKIQKHLYFLGVKIKGKATPMNYDSKEDDIFVCTYPKSGTTWVQMILFQLTGDGEMKVPHISMAIPDLEMDYIYGPSDIRKCQEPRIFKTHQPHETVLGGRGRYIYVMRDGRDVAVSYYHHYQSYKGFRWSFEEFVDMYLNGGAAFGSWADHVKGWKENARNLNVLYISFEELLEDLESGILKIAAFCNITIPDGQLPRILERCSFEYMKEHQDFFDLAMGMFIQKGFSLNRKFIRKGKSGEGKTAFTAKQLQEYGRAFNVKLLSMGLEEYQA